jgi:hypothetical protein
MLLEEYPEALKIKNKYGELPLHIACIAEASSDIIQMILKALPKGCRGKNLETCHNFPESLKDTILR